MQEVFFVHVAIINSGHKAVVMPTKNTKSAVFTIDKK